MHRLVITGTRHGRPDLLRLLDGWVHEHGRPLLVVVGDQWGVDRQAWSWAERRGYPWHREEVDRKRPVPQRYHERNQRMVDHALPGDHLLAFPDTDSRGTWHCYRCGLRAGLVCAVY